MTMGMSTSAFTWVRIILSLTGIFSGAIEAVRSFHPETKAAALNPSETTQLYRLMMDASP